MKDELKSAAPSPKYQDGTARDGPPSELAEVVITAEKQGFDIAPSCLLGQVEVLGLTTTGVGVDDQHAPLRRLCGTPMSAGYVHRRAGMTYCIPGHKAEQRKHPDQHGQRHLVVVCPHEEDDEREEYGGHAE